MKILHISESFEGGVAAAVANYVDLTPEHEHFLLCSKRGGRLNSGILKRFSTVYDLTSGHFSAIKTVRRTVDKVAPDVIHCHSSFGGGYGRLAFFGCKCPALMIYSPHCYAFERRDISWFGRCMYYIMEWILARRTDVVVACSVREKRSAGKLRRKTKAVFVPNLPSVEGGTSLSWAKRKDSVVMMGRLSPQKDPGWFAEVAKGMEGVEFVWVGDGDNKYKRSLKEAGVKVTGWIGPEEVAGILREAKVYLHTARWEGFPIALLDAERCGAAIVAREATYLEGAKSGSVVRDVVGAVREIGGLVSDEERWKKNVAKWRVATEDNNSLVAGEALKSAYAIDKKA